MGSSVGKVAPGSPEASQKGALRWTAAHAHGTAFQFSLCGPGLVHAADMEEEEEEEEEREEERGEKEEKARGPKIHTNSDGHVGFPGFTGKGIRVEKENGSGRRRGTKGVDSAYAEDLEGRLRQLDIQKGHRNGELNGKRNDQGTGGLNGELNGERNGELRRKWSGKNLGQRTGEEVGEWVRECSRQSGMGELNTERNRERNRQRRCAQIRAPRFKESPLFKKGSSCARKRRNDRNHLGAQNDMLGENNRVGKTETKRVSHERDNTLQGRITEQGDIPILMELPSGKPKPHLELPCFSELRSKYEATGIVLGRGNFGVVTIWVNRTTGERKACKTIPKKRLKGLEQIADVKREIRLMRQLSGHPNICELFGVYQDSESVHMLMELCNGGSLSSHILRRKKFPEAEAAVIFRQVAEGVRHMHSQGIMHRDLKPENILLTREGGSVRAVVADLGLALQLRPRTCARGIAGSPFYFAPEVVNGSKYGREADIWSLGVVLYVLLSGMLPFYGETDPAIFEKIRNAKVRFSGRHWNGVSPIARRLVQELLVVDPQYRLMADALVEHEWLRMYRDRRDISL